jgi:hypothetical protein
MDPPFLLWLQLLGIQSNNHIAIEWSPHDDSLNQIKFCEKFNSVEADVPIVRVVASFSLVLCSVVLVLRRAGVVVVEVGIGEGVYPNPLMWWSALARVPGV